jgi:hypothetical protein
MPNCLGIKVGPMEMGLFFRTVACVRFQIPARLLYKARNPGLLVFFPIESPLANANRASHHNPSL